MIKSIKKLLLIDSFSQLFSFSKIKELCIHYKELVLYIVFGVLTTIVNLAVFALVNKLFAIVHWDGVLTGIFSGVGLESILKLLGQKGTAYLDSTVIAWVVAVIFAFITNKLFVFESKSWKASVAGREFAGFIGARLFSLLVELLLMFLMVSVMKMNDFIAKLIVQVIIVILNYVFSKLFIFKKPKQNNSQTLMEENNQC